MNINPAIKAAVIVITIILTVCSMIICYLDLDGAVEVKDVPNAANRIDYIFRAYGSGDRWKWNSINNVESTDGSGGIIDDAEDPDYEGDAGTDIGEGSTPFEETGENLPQWEHSGEYDPSIDILVLVNKEYALDENYVPADLVRLNYCAADRSSEWQAMTREAADAFNKMAEDALAEGHEIVVTTAYRSYNFQNYLYNSYVEKEGQAAADTFSAKPGKSEHQTGLAADVSSASVNYRLTAAFGDTEEGKWLAENCYKYGFIMRYREGKESITGYVYEPWHVRYVGQKAAKEIWEKDLTLEEYLGVVPPSFADSDVNNGSDVE